MNHHLRLFLVLIASLASFIVYYAIWIDWLQDVGAGVYSQHYQEAFFETLSLAGYTYLAIRFTLSRLKPF